MKYIDTSVFVAAYISHDRNHAAAEQFIATLLQRGEQFITSAFALAEFAGYFSRNHSREKANEMVQELLKLGGLTVVYFTGDREFQDSLLSTCVETGLSGADAIHYLIALSHIQADELVTLDRDFLKVAQIIRVNILSAHA